MGNQFYIFGQYTIEFARLCRILCNDEEAERQLKLAIEFYDRQDCQEKVAQLTAELEKVQYVFQKRSLCLSEELKQEIDKALRHASVYKENQEQQKRMNFLSAWQKMIEIGGKTKKELVKPAINAFVHNFNIDRLMLVKCGGNGPEELFNNTGYAFEGDRQRHIEGFFQRNRLGFSTSKINNNYTDYLDIVSLFAKKKVC